jgi:hypothetical protein
MRGHGSVRRPREDCFHNDGGVVVGVALVVRVVLVAIVDKDDDDEVKAWTWTVPARR